MSPPGAIAKCPAGGSTSAEKLIQAAHLILGNCGISLSASKVSRIVRSYQRDVARNGFGFFEFLANSVHLSELQKRGALLNPDVALVISYADPTGESAVNNVMRGNCV